MKCDLIKLVFEKIALAAVWQTDGRNSTRYCIYKQKISQSHLSEDRKQGKKRNVKIRQSKK